MNLINKRILGHPAGIWIAFIALSLLILAWCMQAYSLFDWEGAINLGLQNERFTGDAVERAWAHESWSVAIADMLWPMPICVIAFIGLIRKSLYGFAAGLMEFAIGVYFPLFFAFQRWSTYQESAIIAIFLWTIPSLFGIVGLWVNRREFT